MIPPATLSEPPNLPAALVPLVETVRQLTSAASKALRGHLARTRRLIANLDDDLQRTGAAEQLQLSAEVLKTHLPQVAKGMTQIVLAVPWLPGQTVTIGLRPELSAHDNLRQIFQRAKGLARGALIAAERRSKALTRLAELEHGLLAHGALLQRAQQWQAAKDGPNEATERPRTILRDAQNWQLGLAALGVVPVGTQPAVERQPAVVKAKVPKGVDVFCSPAGAIVYAGRNAAANDVVVTRLLRGRDLWFHLRDGRGAHVVLRCGSAPPTEAEKHACAVLCAHLSGVTKGDHAEIAVCFGKNVRKVKGAPAGSVYTGGGSSLRVVVAAPMVDGFYARRHGATTERPRSSS